ncbi:AT-rich interactive domain-containing protein 1A-like [Oopsacas minuta]|uniref:AT-rich interactive domain-containing protein 1A-like n=1 Tax=Oopsacas minuta TaxID=111878 RepID=A0AAV7JZH1_9METZ|nr:AT-rich interactive domain-containing protein 1A-like [Oopsacas minuta]
MESYPKPQGQGLYPQTQGIVPASGYAPPPQVAPGTVPNAPPPQGYAQPVSAPPAQQVYTQATAPPQGYAPQPGYAPAPQGYAPAPASQGYAPVPAVAPAHPAPTMESTTQDMGNAFDSVLGKVKQMAVGGPAQPKTTIGAFKNGNVISLKSKVSNYLRILADGRVDCRGPNGKDEIAQFKVNSVAEGVVSLSSVKNPTHYLSICQGIVNGTGQGGTLCHFTLVEAPDKSVSFSSVGEVGLCIGVTQDGAIADPKHCQPGHHFAQFTAAVIREGVPVASPSSTGPAPGLPVSYALRDGNVIQMISKMSGKPMLIAKNGVITGSGDYGELSELLVIEKAPGLIMLRSAPIKSFYLCIFKNEFEGRGQGGPSCEMRVHPTHDNYVAFESVKTPGQFMGVAHNGMVMRADKLAAGQVETHFRIRIVKMAPIKEQMPELLRYDGQPSVLNSLRDGATIQLVSRSYGDTIEIKESGLIGSKGGSGISSDFIVRSRGGNIVSFLNKKHPGYVLCIQNGAVKGKQGTGLQVDFVIHETYDRHILLESLANQGQFVAISPTGELKAPAKTSIQDPDCQFYVK